MAKIIVIEGPAGVGKSTFIKAAVERDPNWTIGISHSLEKATGQRLPYDPREANIKSIANDTYKCLQAIEAVAAGKEIVLIDRLYLSQLVYHEVRTGQDVVSEILDCGSDIMFKNHLNRMFMYCRQEILFRGGQYPDNIHFDIDVWLLCSETYTELQARRATSGKHYPAGMIDYSIYKRIQDTKIFTSLPTNISVSSLVEERF